MELLTLLKPKEMTDYSEINKDVFKEYFKEHPAKLSTMQEVARAILFGGNANLMEFLEMISWSESIDAENDNTTFLHWPTDEA
jgi:hypothetical protein